MRVEDAGLRGLESGGENDGFGPCGSLKRKSPQDECGLFKENPLWEVTTRPRLRNRLPRRLRGRPCLDPAGDPNF